MLRRILGVEISFVRWLVLGLPVVILLFGFLATYFYLRLLRRLELTPAASDVIRDELRRLGPVSRGQRNVLVAFAVTVTLWLLPGVIALTGLGDSAVGRWYAAAVPEAVAALTGATLLFLLPVSWPERRFTLTWEQAVRIDWGIILLFGGGLAMGELAFATGLAESLGRGIASWLPANSAFALTVLFTGVAIIMSEAASNTASANMVVPVAIAVAQAAGVNPVPPALGATLGASMGFMMPISTPPNAIVYASGHVPIGAMVKHGVVLDLAGFVVIVALVGGLGWIL
jgi:sodium-dependent dicarboxylate transporter 2/3/5